MLRVCIVEDEEASLCNLEELILRWAKESGTECEISVFRDGMNFISDYRRIYDVIFMDIEMPHLDGLKAAAKLREADGDVALIFVTRLAKYAIRGYEVDASGYLIKPVEYPSLKRRLDKIFAEMLHGGDSRPEYIIKTAEGAVRLDLARLMYVEVMGHVLIYHTADRQYRAYGKISAEEQRLPSERFFRCGKSYIVNLGYVKKITRAGVEVGGVCLPVGRSYKKQLSAAFIAYNGGGNR